MHAFFAALIALSQAQRSSIDTIVERVMRERQIPGLSLGVARDGVPVYVRGYGLRDVERRLPADGYTIYRIGSITKQFTAAMVMQDVSAGKIALADRVWRYLPEANGVAKDVTIEQLLAQTSGVGSGARPGTAWVYDNANYVLLGRLLESVDGAAFPELLRERILEPLALRSTSFGLPPAANVALGYTWRDGWRALAPAAAETEDSIAAGAIASNVPDLLRWLDGLRAARVVPSTAFDAMATSSKLPGGILTNYGYGFFVTNWFGYRTIEHPGYVDGFSSQDVLIRNDGLEIAVLANCGAVDLTPLSKSILAALDPPLDVNLSALPSRPPQNENLTITADLKAIVQTPGFATLGTLSSIEFVERSLVEGVTHDRYRLTFSTGQWWVTIAYRQDGAIEALTLSPPE